MGYRLNRLGETIFMAMSKPMLTEFGIHYRLESCGTQNYVIVTSGLFALIWHTFPQDCTCLLNVLSAPSALWPCFQGGWRCNVKRNKPSPLLPVLLSPCNISKWIGHHSHIAMRWEMRPSSYLNVAHVLLLSGELSCFRVFSVMFQSIILIQSLMS